MIFAGRGIEAKGVRGLQDGTTFYVTGDHLSIRTIFDAENRLSCLRGLSMVISK